MASYKYLGVWITSSLNWSLQIEETCKKARCQIGFLYRKFYLYASNSTFLRLYLTYIHPQLEYAAAVLDPHQRGLINSLESVQKFALKASTKNWNAGYQTLIIKTCNIPTLEERRHVLKLSILYIPNHKINGHTVIPIALVEKRTQQKRLRNSTSILLQRPVAHTNTHLHSFFPHTTALWNNLALSVQMSENLYSFKHALHFHDVIFF